MSKIVNETFADLMTECDRLRAERDAAVAMLRRMEWSNPAESQTGRIVCRECNQSQPDHAPDCALTAILTTPQGPKEPDREH